MVWQIESPGEWLPNVVVYFVFLSFLCFLSVGMYKWEAYDVINYLLRLSQARMGNIIYHDTVLGIRESQIIKALFLIPIVISIGWIIFKLLQ